MKKQFIGAVSKDCHLPSLFSSYRSPCKNSHTPPSQPWRGFVFLNSTARARSDLPEPLNKQPANLALISHRRAQRGCDGSGEALLHNLLGFKGIDCLNGMNANSNVGHRAIEDWEPAHELQGNLQPIATPAASGSRLNLSTPSRCSG